MKRNRLSLFALAFTAAVLWVVGLATAVFTPTAHAAPLETVTTLADSGAGSLRQAIANVDPGGTINFAVSGTILLLNELVINKDLTIQGNMPITVSGNNAVRVFVVNAGTFVTLDSLTIANGNTPGDGGGIYNNGMLTVNNSTISGNSAGNAGGGIINNSGALTVNNSTLSGNSATGNGGGGIFNNAGGTLTVNNSTLSGNNGGGLEQLYLNSGTLNLGGTIIANSLSPDDCFLGGGTFNDLGNNLIEDTGTGACGLVNGVNGNIIGSDPSLGALANNGGSTRTHALLPGSPAIDAGNCTSGPATDQRGATRPQDDTCDIGAFELLSCVAGSYFNGVSCVSAPAGSFVPTDGATSATLCSVGTYQPNEGATSCLLAPVNTFVDSEGATAPTACPAHTYNPLQGSASVSDCRAAVTVTTLVDESDGCGVGVGCSLREAIVAATNGQTIDFAVTGTIVLGSALVVDKSVTIYGNMPITVSGNNAVRVFVVNAVTSVTLDSLTIANGNVSGNGGGIVNVGTLTVNNSTLSSNSASNAGGGIVNVDVGTLTVNNSTLSSNSANFGGGIVNFGTLTVNNSTLSGNSATGNGGGGIFNNGGTLTVNNSTLSGNNGGTNYEQLYLGSGTLNLGNTIIANSLSPNDCVVDGGTFNDLGNNLIEDTDTGACGLVNGVNGNIIGSDPSLGALANNGGSTRTHALLPGSLAINAGNCTSGPTTDQRGATRPQDATCDIGAYEETGTLQCGIAAGNSYAFPTQSGVSIFVNSESDLDCLYVDRLPFNHPHATGLTNGANLRTGQYWQIRGLQADGITPATTFNVDLTLPYATASASTRACKWLDGVGPGFGWNCLGGGMGTTFGVGTVTRQGVTAFSQWAVGDEVGPTAVTLAQHSAQTTSFSNTLWLWGIALLSLTLWAWRTVRTRQEMVQS